MTARIASLLITFWAGSLWTVCAIVAPTLFGLLEDRALAGQLAARFFYIGTWIGAAVGSVLIVMSLGRRLALPGRWLVYVAAGLPLASHWLLGPLMNQARASGDMAKFGLLHAGAGACFLAACVALLVLVWKFNRPAG